MAEKSGFKPFQFDKIKNDKEKTAVAVEYVPGDQAPKIIAAGKGTIAERIIEKAKESLYGSKQITLPTPHCVVFYNGDQEMPEEKTLRLSDAFENKEHRSDVELAVKVLNINHGHNAELMKQCKILEEFLRKYRSEVLGMLLEEFDVKKYERSLREEGVEIGREEGIELGRAEGRDQTLIQQVYRKYVKNLMVEETAEMLEVDEETIRKIYSAIKTVGTDDVEEIYKQYVKM